MNISIDFDKVVIKDGKLIIDIDKSTQSFFERMLRKKRDNVKLSELEPGDEFKIGDEVFIVLEQTDNGTRVISKEFAYNNLKFGDSSNWNVSPIRNILNGEYLKKIANIVGAKNILPIHRNLTSIDGLDDYSVCLDKVSLLTSAEYAKYHKILGLNSDYYYRWWLITPASTPSNGYYQDVCIVRCNGIFGWADCRLCGSVRPFMTLNSSISVQLNNC